MEDLIEKHSFRSPAMIDDSIRFDSPRSVFAHALRGRRRRRKSTAVEAERSTAERFSVIKKE